MSGDIELWCPSVDVCAICGDSECGGLQCYSSLFGDDDAPASEADFEAVEQIQGWVRRGRLGEQTDEALARAENRPWPHRGWRHDPQPSVDRSARSGV